MAGLSERALRASLQALVQRNRQLAYGVILRDQYLDERETELNRLCLEFLVRHQPVAGHLRFIFTTIQINKELERIGDYAESVARQVLAISELEPQPPYALFIELGELSIRMLGEAVQAFLQKDADLASRAMPMEEQANTLRNSINAELMELSRKNQLPAAALNPLMTIARRYERVADQAKNLCEEVLYMCTGEFAKHKGGDAFHILFFDMNNACLSQIAEGLGNAMRLPRFRFNSAGAAPQPVDARAVKFMAEKGIDISGQTSKALEQVPQWEQDQVVVALGARARKALPVRPAKTIFFTWSIKDPAEMEGSADVVHAAFESAGQSLEAHIKELVGAILEEPQTETKP
jgi:phosphate transport system protein